MQQSSVHASADLRDYFSAYHFFRSDADEVFEYPVKAGPKAGLVFFLSGSFNLVARDRRLQFPRIALVGPVLTPYRVAFPTGEARIAIAEFTETGCYELFGESPLSVLNSCRDAAELMASVKDEELEKARESVEALEIVLRRLAAHRLPLSEEAINRIEAVKNVAGRIKSDIDRPFGIAELARAAGLSVRTVQRYFLHVTGLTPKRYSDLVRFTKLYHLYLESRKNFTDILLRMGYYDQSHVIKKFHQYAGIGPKPVWEEPFKFSSALSTPFAGSLSCASPGKAGAR